MLSTTILCQLQTTGFISTLRVPTPQILYPSWPSATEVKQFVMILTATEFFMSATALPNSLKCNSGQYTNGNTRSPLFFPGKEKKCLQKLLTRYCRENSPADWSKGIFYRLLIQSDRLGERKKNTKNKTKNKTTTNNKTKQIGSCRIL